MRLFKILNTTLGQRGIKIIRDDKLTGTQSKRARLTDADGKFTGRFDLGNQAGKPLFAVYILVKLFLPDAWRFNSGEGIPGTAIIL